MFQGATIFHTLAYYGCYMIAGWFLSKLIGEIVAAFYEDSNQ